MLWIVRIGSPWRDLPPIFGKWNSVFVRFNQWSEGDVWYRIFAALRSTPLPLTWLERYAAAGRVGA